MKFLKELFVRYLDTIWILKFRCVIIMPRAYILGVQSEKY